NPQPLDPVCPVFVEKVPLEPTIPLNDALHTWFSSFSKTFPPFRAILKK
ncbi:hypothetical protein AVEN_211045-1, partial [Araneus ventricosus]